MWLCLYNVFVIANETLVQHFAWWLWSDHPHHGLSLAHCVVVTHLSCGWMMWRLSPLLFASCPQRAESWPRNHSCTTFYSFNALQKELHWCHLHVGCGNYTLSSLYEVSTLEKRIIKLVVWTFFWV